MRGASIARLLLVVGLLPLLIAGADVTTGGVALPTPAWRAAPGPRVRLALWRGQGARVLVTLSPAAREGIGRALEAEGARVGWLADGRLVAAVDARALSWLATHPDVVQLTRDDAATLQPLEVTTARIGATQARALPPGLSGQGVTIALMDTRVDLRHPALWRADGPSYAWVDVDGDGVFTPGTDAVDRDGDGRAGRDEILQTWRASTFDVEGRQLDAGRGFEATLDWLYVDLNRDGVRNAGQQAGFFESDPGYGEPLFIAEDLDRDGRLDPDERLILLKTSRVRVLRTGSARYVRGEDLIAAIDDDGLRFHGTAVAGILAGGHPGLRERVGVAPGAELLVYVAPDELSVIEALDDAVGEGARIALHEFSQPFDQPLDGSTALEAAMQAARDGGMIQVVPTGNLNRGDKHAQHMSGDGPMRLRVPEGVDGPLSVFLQWRGPDAAVTLITPGGARLLLPADGQLTEGAVTITSVRDLTDRQTRVLWIVADAQDAADSAALEGEWALEVDTGASGGAPVEVWGRVRDGDTVWRGGAGWVEATRDVGTLSFPSSADVALAVGAYGGRSDRLEDDGSRVGELRGYSGRGPRLDGVAIVDLVAPDDPLTTVGVSAALEEIGWVPGWWGQFGGTSGAAPHVAGALALLIEQDPSRGPDALEALLRDAASLAGAPDAQLATDAWGAGRLEVYAALYQQPTPEPHAAPRAALTAAWADGVLALDASGSRDPEGSAMQWRFDLEHDGRFDTPWQDTPTLSREVAFAAGRRVARVQVRDARGATGDALAAFVVGGVAEDMGEVADAGVDMGPPEPPREPQPDCALCASARPSRPGAPLCMLLIVCALLARTRRDAAHLARAPRRPL